MVEHNPILTSQMFLIFLFHRRLLRREKCAPRIEHHIQRKLRVFAIAKGIEPFQHLDRFLKGTFPTLLIGILRLVVGQGTDDRHLIRCIKFREILIPFL